MYHVNISGIKRNRILIAAKMKRRAKAAEMYRALAGYHPSRQGEAAVR